MKGSKQPLGTNEEQAGEELAPGIYGTFQAYRLARLIVIFLGIAVIVYVAIPLPLKYSAGKETTISLVYKVVVDMRLEVILPYVLAALFAGLWRRERRIRKMSVRREHERVAKLEAAKDPNRTSSGLEE